MYDKKTYVKDENYITVQGWMKNKLKLKGNELMLFAIIYGFSQTEEQRFSGSVRYLSEWLECSKRTVYNLLQSLENKGYIIKYSNFINNVKYCQYQSVWLLDLDSNNNNLATESSGGGGEIIAPPVKSEDSSNNGKYQATVSSDAVSSLPIFSGEKISPVVNNNHRGSEKTSPEEVKIFHQGGEEISPNNIVYNKDDNIHKINQSISQALDIFKSNIEYDILTRDYGQDIEKVNELLAIMTETYCSQKVSLQINGELIPTEVIKAQLMKVSRVHIEYVISSLSETKNQINNIKAYILACLYNAPNTFNLFQQVKVNAEKGENHFNAEDKKPKPSRFHNFDEREYDPQEMERLERILIDN